MQLRSRVFSLMAMSISNGPASIWDTSVGFEWRTRTGTMEHPTDEMDERKVMNG